MADVMNSILELGELTAYSDELWEIMLLEDNLTIENNHRIRLEIAHGAKEIVQFKSRGAIAIVPLAAGTILWAESIAELLRGDYVPVTVFDDEAQARKWLSIHMGHSHFEKTTMRSSSRGDEPRARNDRR
ncbi:MAG: hypothetical protein WD558_09300 [Pseudomonadales bacterium]